MLLKPFRHPASLRPRQILWVVFSVFLIVLGTWYSLAVTVPSLFILLGWGLILCLGLWSVFSTPLWTFSPQNKTITQAYLFHKRTWDFKEIQFILFPIEHKNWQNHIALSYLLTINDGSEMYIIGLLNPRELSLIQSLGQHYHIPLEVKE